MSAGSDFPVDLTGSSPPRTRDTGALKLCSAAVATCLLVPPSSDASRGYVANALTGSPLRRRRSPLGWRAEAANVIVTPLRVQHDSAREAPAISSVGAAQASPPCSAGHGGDTELDSDSASVSPTLRCGSPPRRLSTATTVNLGARLSVGGRTVAEDSDVQMIDDTLEPSPSYARNDPAAMAMPPHRCTSVDATDLDWQDTAVVGRTDSLLQFVRIRSVALTPTLIATELEVTVTSAAPAATHAATNEEVATSVVLVTTHGALEEDEEELLATVPVLTPRLHSHAELHSEGLSRNLGRTTPPPSSQAAGAKELPNVLGELAHAPEAPALSDDVLELLRTPLSRVTTPQAGGDQAPVEGPPSVKPPSTQWVAAASVAIRGMVGEPSVSAPAEASAEEAIHAEAAAWQTGRVGAPLERLMFGESNSQDSPKRPVLDELLDSPSPSERTCLEALRIARAALASVAAGDVPGAARFSIPGARGAVWFVEQGAGEQVLLHRVPEPDQEYLGAALTVALALTRGRRGAAAGSAASAPGFMAAFQNALNVSGRDALEGLRCIPLSGELARLLPPELGNPAVSATRLLWGGSSGSRGVLAGAALGRAKGVVDELLRRIGVTAFKIGITCNPFMRWQAYARDGYKQLHLIYGDENARAVQMLESCLIDHFGMRTGCRNIARGGEGPVGRGPYFTYVALAPARSSSRRRSPSRRRREPSPAKRRQEPPPARRRSPSRSRSPAWRREPSPARRRSPSPKDAGHEPSSGKFETKIEEGVPKSGGVRTYRAEIFLPRPGGTRPGMPATADTKMRTVCIRGPSRSERSLAEEDAQKFLEAAGPDGNQNNVRAMQKELGVGLR